jgi:cytochrome c oxidase subunit 3
MLAVGTVVWLASEFMFFGALFAAYYTLRSETEVWPPAGVDLDLVGPILATVVMVAAAGTITMVSRTFARGERAACQRWLVVTLGLGALFVASQVREFFVTDFSVDTDAYGSIYFIMLAVHGLHAIAGVALIVIGLAFVTGDRPLARRGPAIDSIVYYWYFLVIVWILQFLTIYVIQ